MDNVEDSVIEAEEEGNDTVQSSISYTLGENVENLQLNADAEDINGTGNDTGGEFLLLKQTITPAPRPQPEVP